MNKREQKRHKRQVARAKSRVKLSEPDVRTPDEIRAAREASRPVGGWRRDPQLAYSKPPARKRPSPAAPSPSKAEG